MKTSRSLIITFLVLTVILALYRIIPGRPGGFAPQLAVSLFAGAVIKDKRLALVFPILSLFISDLIFQLLYLKGITPYAGFYEGQLVNYLLFAGVTCIGFLIRKISVGNVLLYSFAGSASYFLLSNFLVWQSGAGYGRPKNFSGLMAAYVDGLPFFRNSLYATLIFGAILFGGWVVFGKRVARPATA
jgi:hypothetical protein